MRSVRKYQRDALGLNHSISEGVGTNPSSFVRDQLFSFKSVSIYLTSLSLFGIVHDGLKFGLSELFHNALSYYGAFLRFIFQPIEIFAEKLFSIFNELFNWDFQLIGEWRHAFMVMGLYFLVDLRSSYIARNLPKPTIISTAVFGLIVAIVFSTAGGYLGEVINPILAILTPILGFGIYELLKAPVSATYVRIPSFSWRQTYIYYSVLYGIANLALGGVATLIFALSPWSREPGAEVLILVIFLFLLAMRNALVAWTKASLILSDASRLTTFLTSGSVRITINVIYALFLLFGYILTNAYLSNQGM